METLNSKHLVFVRATSTARIPTRGSKYAAGWDVYLDDSAIILPRDTRVLASTGLMFAGFPSEMYLRVAPRSGLAVRHSIDIGAGVIDADYRGVIKVLLINNGPDAVRFEQGDRIAQLIPERIVFIEECIEYEGSIDDFNTARGAGGFGSTGA